MDTAETILLIVLVLNSLALIGLIMVQQGQGADAGAAFGSGGSNTVFGSTGSANFLTRLTTWLAIAFFAITFGLAWIAKEKATAGIDIGLGVPTVQSAPATPAVDEDLPALNSGSGSEQDSFAADDLGDLPATSDDRGDVPGT